MPDAWNASRMAGSFDSARAAYVVIPAAPSASADFGPTPASWVRSSGLAALGLLGGCGSFGRRGRSRFRGCRLGLGPDRHLVVGDGLGASEHVDSGCHDALKFRRLVGRERAVDQLALLGSERNLDGFDRPAPVAFVLDEDGALALVDVASDRAHERVLDTDVAEPRIQARQGRADSATDGGAWRTEHHCAGDHSDRPAPYSALASTDVVRLLDRHPSPLVVIGDRGVDDLDVLVALVDLLDRFQQSSGRIPVVDEKHGEGLIGLLAHR